MDIEIRIVSSKKELNQFIHLPASLHKDHKNWIPPLYPDEREFYNPRKNKSFAHCDTVLVLAFRGEEPVGRIMGIIHDTYNKTHNEKSARFFGLECENNPDVAGLLLKFVEDWAKKWGMEKVVGPLGFSDKDPQGFMIEGFDEPKVVTTATNHEYMIPLIEKCGFSKEIDLVSYKLLVPDKIPAFYEEIKKRTEERNNVKMLEFTTKRQLRPYIKPVFLLVNETFREIFGFSEVDSGEIEFMANRYMPVINPKYVKVVINSSNQVIGFLWALPDIAEGIRRAGGRLFPVGIFKIFRSIQKTKLLVMMIGAIKQEYRNYGLDAMMGVRLLEEAKKGGMKVIDSHLVLESNLKMRAEYEKLGGEVFKRFRIYKKNL